MTDMFARSPADRALWDAIMADPEDDAARLVYADVLQRRGEPLGDLIAIQCSSSYPRDRALVQRVRELLEANTDRWKAELGLEPSARVYFERGLPDLTHVPTDASVFALLERAPIRFVYFTDHDASVETMRMLGRDPRFARVRTLSTFCEATALRALLAAPSFAVTRLIIRNCVNDAGRAIAEINPRSLASLTFSEMGNARFDDTGVAALSRARLPELSTLDIDSQAMTVASLDHIARSTFDRLEHLHLRAGIETGAAALAGSPNFSHLETLDLDFQLDGAELAVLARSPAFPELRTLNLDFNRITDDGLEALATAAGMPQLESLGLGYASLTGPGLRAFASAPRFANLRRLSLQGATHGPDAAIAIAESPNAVGLRELDLSACKARDDGAFALAKSPYLDELTSLAFGRNKVTHAGRKALVDRFGERVRLDK